MQNSDFLKLVQAMADEVRRFHEFWPQVARLPEHGVREVLEETLCLQEEEVAELRAETAADGGAIDLERASEEAADVLFVALGTIYRLGDAGLEGLRKVVSKNSAKRSGDDYFFDEKRRKVRRVKRRDGG